MKTDIYSFKKRKTWIALIGMLALFTISYLSSNKINTMGLVTSSFSLTEQRLSQNLSYVDDINLDVNESSTYDWLIGHFCSLENCNLRLISVSGFISANQSGNINIYLENLGNRYLIFNKSFELNKTVIPRNITVEQNITVVNETTNETYIQTVNTTQEVNVTIEQPEVFYFNDSCIETCNLIGIFNQSFYKIIFNLSPNFSVRISNISYEWLIVESLFINKSEESKTVNFSTDKIEEVKGTSGKAILVKLVKEGENQLWLFDLVNEKQKLIGFGESASSGFHIGLKGNFVFWLSKNSSVLFAYDSVNEIFLQKILPAEGQRKRVVFDEIPWEVIVGAEEFYFYSQATGEVFSDDDSCVREMFRARYNLDSFLSEEELGNLNLEIEPGGENA